MGHLRAISARRLSDAGANEPFQRPSRCCHRGVRERGPDAAGTSVRTVPGSKCPFLRGWTIVRRRRGRGDGRQPSDRGSPNRSHVLTPNGPRSGWCDSGQLGLTRCDRRFATRRWSGEGSGWFHRNMAGMGEGGRPEVCCELPASQRARIATGRDRCWTGCRAGPGPQCCGTQ